MPDVATSTRYRQLRKVGLVAPTSTRNRQRDAMVAMQLKSLEDLLHHELKDLYSAENQLVKALPKMAKAASNEELRAGIEEHLEQTKAHVERLDEIANQLGISLTGHKCKAMESLIEEGEDLVSEEGEASVLDAGIIGAAQRVEHYEIAAYGTAATLAQTVGLDEVADLLNQTLEEEKETDRELTALAESSVNLRAASGSTEE